MRIARLCELLVGLIFLVGAAMKAANIPGFAAGIRSYHVFYNPDMLYNLAVFTIAVETLLGGALIAGIRMRGFIHAVGIALLLFFSGMIVYAWAAYGLEDCGCFGDYVKMGPGASIVKNLIMMAMLVVPWVTSRKKEPAKQSLFGHAGARIASVAVSVAIVACIAAFNMGDSLPANAPTPTPTAASPSGTPSTAPAPQTGEFSGIQVADGAQSLDLGDGVYLVAIMSATCEHCKASIEPLNNLIAQSTTPPVVGLMMGEPDDIEQFRLQTSPMFPTQLVETMKWLELLGDATAPPRFVLVKDGAPVEHWDEHVPTADALAAKVELEAAGDMGLS